MALTIDDMLAIMESEGVSLPAGTGRNGAVIAADLRRALGNHFFAKRAADGADPVRLEHLRLRMIMDPMKAFRYDKLSAEEQRRIMESDSWYMEEKYNGWRIVLTYLPGHGFAAFGGNCSDVDFLPLDYTDKIMFRCGDAFFDLHDARFSGLMPMPAVVDTEVLCYTVVENRKGSFSSNTLDTVGTILSLPPSEARALQYGGAHLDFKAFDLVRFYDNKPERGAWYTLRRMNLLETATAKAWPDAVGVAPSTPMDKASLLRTFWNRGGEGAVVKHAKGMYVPGGRKKEIAIKIKRTMSGDIGDDLDAFISGFVNTPEWSKKGLIGGVELSVYLNEKEHVIATVSAMPDAVREYLTDSHWYDPSGEYDGDREPRLRSEFYGKVLTIDGQELSARNRRIMHAKADWAKGFRQDKDASQCVLHTEDFETAMF